MLNTVKMHVDSIRCLQELKIIKIQLQVILFDYDLNISLIELCIKIN